MALKGTQTESNLWAAFSGESQTRNRYNYFAEVARKEGHEDLATIFDVLAEQEKNHAKIMLKFLNGIGDSITNLQIAAQNESYEGHTMYKNFERVAAEEGFDEIAKFFGNIAKVESEHEKIFLSFLNKLTSEKEKEKKEE